jgi:hypothetical protein
LKDPVKRAGVERVVELLVELRARYDEFAASGDIRKSCGSPECGMWDFRPRAAFVMDNLRERILHEFGRVAPGQVPHLRRRW